MHEQLVRSNGDHLIESAHEFIPQWITSLRLSARSILQKATFCTVREPPGRLGAPTHTLRAG